MGLARAEALAHKQFDAYGTVSLSDTFSKGGVSEVTTADILSIENFLRAEENLGHVPPDSIKDIDDMHVKHTDDVVHYLFDKKLRGYNESDIMAEQSGDIQKSDADVVTAGGYMKTTVSTIGHQQNSEKENSRKMRRVLNDLERDPRMQALLADLDSLKDELKALDEKIAEVNEIQELLADGDLNDSTDLSSARRKRVDSILKKQGSSLEDYKRADGSIDQERLKAAMNDRSIDLQRQRTETIDAIRENGELRSQRQEEISNKTEAAIAQNDIEAIKQVQSTENIAASKAIVEANPALAADVAQFDANELVSQAYDDQETLAYASNDDDWGFSDATDDSYAAADNTEQGWGFSSSTDDAPNYESADTIAYVEQDNAYTTGERSYGSFAVDTDVQDNTSVITNMFAQVSDPAAVEQQQQAQADIAAEQELQNTTQAMTMRGFA
ncbi:MAG: hypothetical protein ACRBCK_03865 [Alphaproteobacteria bacterium]